MAVYTHITLSEAQSLCQKHYDLPPVTACHALSEGTDNSNYRLETRQGNFILTIFEGSVAPENLPLIFDFSKQVNDQVIKTPQVIRTRSGDLLSKIKNKPAAIVSFLDGRSIDPPTAAHAAQIGQCLARLHLIAAEQHLPLPSNLFSLPKLRHITQQRSDNIARFHADWPDLIASLLDDLEQNLPEKAALPSGPIHSDIFPDNVFFQDNTLTAILDFYISCQDWFAYDLVITLNAWCFDQQGHAQTDHIEKFLAAYLALRPLSAAEQSALPLIGEWAAIRIAITRLRDYYPDNQDIVFTPRNPQPYMNIVNFYKNEQLEAYLK